MNNYKITHQEITTFYQMSELERKQVIKRLYAHFNKPITKEIFDLRQICEDLQIEFLPRVERNEIITESNIVQEIRELVSLYLNEHQTNIFITLAKYRYIVKSTIEFNLFKSDIMVEDIDCARLYTLCKYLDLMELYDKYLHNKYCSSVKAVYGDTLFSIIKVGKSDTVETIMPTNLFKLSSELKGYNEYDIPIFEVKDDLKRLLCSKDIVNLIYPTPSVVNS